MTNIEVVIHATPRLRMPHVAAAVIRSDPFRESSRFWVYSVPCVVARLHAPQGGRVSLARERVRVSVAEEELRVLAGAQPLPSPQIVPALLQLQLLPLAERRFGLRPSRHPSRLVLEVGRSLLFSGCPAVDFFGTRRVVGGFDFGCVGALGAQVCLGSCGIKAPHGTSRTLLWTSASAGPHISGFQPSNADTSTCAAFFAPISQQPR